MSEKSQTIWVSFRFKDQQYDFEHDLAQSPLLIGRKLLQRLFDVTSNVLRNVSRRHIEVQYDEGNDQVWATDTSLLGTLVRIVGEETGDLGPEFLFHHERFLVRRHMRIRLQNEDDTHEPEDVVIEIENANYAETLAIMSKPASWDRLLSHLSTVRAAHLIGMPGTGKSMLAEKLLAPVNSLWQRQLSREFGGTPLVAWIDCHKLDSGDEPLWRSLARQMIVAVKNAAETQDLNHVLSDLDAALRYFDSNIHEQSNEVNAVIRGAVSQVINKAGVRPIFVFDHFDDIFSDVDKFMLYQLYQLHQWHSVGEEMQFVLVTRRPLVALRDDIRDDGVFEFVNLFVRHAIRMGCVPREEFSKLWKEVAPEFHLISAEILNQLFALSGGHAGLTRELYSELAERNWLTQAPERWSELLRSVNWRRTPSQSCAQIWSDMSISERESMRGLMQGETPPPNILEQFRSLGILRVDGTLFSPLFAPIIGLDGVVRPRTAATLFISPSDQRVFVNGQDVTGKLTDSTRNILFYLHGNANRLCTYQELIENTQRPDEKLDTIATETLRGSLQLTVSRLCRVVDPKRTYISNEPGRGYKLRYEAASEKDRIDA